MGGGFCVHVELFFDKIEKSNWLKKQEPSFVVGWNPDMYTLCTCIVGSSELHVQPVAEVLQHALRILKTSVYLGHVKSR